MILKVGGSVLSDIDELENAAIKIVEYIISSKQAPIIVVSAFKGYTDELSKLSKRVGSISSSFVITVGEQITAGLFAQALEKYGNTNNKDSNNIKAIPLTGWQVPIVLDEECEDGILVHTEKLQKLFEHNIISVVTGFQAINKNGAICDLGRGGSDLSAVCIAKALNKPCVLLKKSGGICAADPDLVSDAFIWEDISYDNLLYLAQSGSRVVQTEAVLFAKAHNVALELTGMNFNTLTKIKENNKKFWSIFSYNHRLRIVTTIKNHQMFNEYGFDFNLEGDFYEFRSQFFDIKNEARKIYEVCKKFL